MERRPRSNSRQSCRESGTGRPGFSPGASLTRLIRMHVSAHVGELHRAERQRTESGEFEDPVAGERAMRP